MLRLGISSGAFYPHILTENAPDRAAELGIQDLEVMLQTAGEYDRLFLRGLHRRANEAGVAIRSCHLFQRLHPLYSGYERRTAEALDLIRRAADSAAECGVPILVWHGASRDELRGDDLWRRFLTAVELVGSICHEHQIAVAIENVSWCVVSSVRDVQRLNRAIDTMSCATAIGFTFDSFQALESNANPFMLLAAMGQRLRHVHISDGLEGSNHQRHLLPGSGSIPWSPIVRMIAQAGYDGPMMLEAPVPDQAAMESARAVINPLIREFTNGSQEPVKKLPPGLREGIALFNAGDYYECHEVIEHEWHAERAPIRRLYQGILQIGVGLHHIRGGNQRGAILLLSDGIAKVSEFLPTALGLDTARLALEAQICLDEVALLDPAHLAAFDWSLAPKIALPNANGAPGDTAR